MDVYEDLKIDHQALDIECLKQPQLYMKYSELVAEAKLEMDQTKERMEVVRAECDKAIREEFQQQGTKVTETVISGAVVLHPECRKAQKELNAAKHQHEILSAAVKSLDQKKASIEGLIKLMLASYFASPSTPRDLDKEVNLREIIQAKGREEVREKIRGTRRRKE